MLAGTAMVGTAAIPWLIGRAIDEIDEGDRAGSSCCAPGWSSRGVVRLGFSVARRLVAGRVSLGVEYDLRNAALRPPAGARARLLRPPADRPADVARDRRPAVGPLLPRLRACVHRPGALTIVLAAVAMFALDPELAAMRWSPVPFVVIVAFRYGQPLAAGDAGGPAADRRADRRRGGERLRRARGEGVRARAAPARALPPPVRRVFDQAMYATRLQRVLQPADRFLPQLGLAAILLVGGRRVIDGTLTLGEFTAFYTYVLMLIAPMRIARHGAGLGAARDRVGRAAVRDARPRAADRRAGGAPPLPAGNGRVRAARRLVRLRATGRRRCATSTDRRGRHHGGAGRRHRLGQDALVSLLAAPVRRRPTARC